MRSQPGNGLQDDDNHQRVTPTSASQAPRQETRDDLIQELREHETGLRMHKVMLGMAEVALAQIQCRDRAVCSVMEQCIESTGLHLQRVADIIQLVGRRREQGRS